MLGSLSELSRKDARAKALLSLGLSEAATDGNVRREVLRALTWALTGGTAPVHVLRLLNRSVDYASGLASSSQEAEGLRSMLRDDLDALADAGDVAGLDGGYWLPSPTRLVDIHEDTAMLIVGGLPTRAIPHALRQTLVFDGPFRRVESQAALSLELPVEELSDWARRPTEPLDQWAQRITNLDLPEYSAPRDGSTTQLYLPEITRPGAPQFKRWAERYDDVIGRRLARRTRVFGAREYRVVEVAGGNLVRSGAVLAPREARRLMYASDARCGNATRARWIARPPGGELVLTSDLPEPEHRMLGALGRLEPSTEKVYERRWKFTKEPDQVLELLHALSIDVRHDGKTRR